MGRDGADGNARVAGLPRLVVPAVWWAFVGVHEPGERVEVQGRVADPLPRHNGPRDCDGTLQGPAEQFGANDRAGSRRLGFVGVSLGYPDDQAD